MMKALAVFGGLVAAQLPAVFACGHDGQHDSCYGPSNRYEHVRHVKRIQPGAQDAPYGPDRCLEWGQVNFLHSTDTHGWLEGHINQRNSGADWGDFVSFTHLMKKAARQMGVDLLLVDTGDLHDGTGFSDATSPDGEKSMHIFNAVPYDILTIGNHELYLAESTYQMFLKWAQVWGDRYITSNVKAFNQTSQRYEYIGATSRYFKTEMGLNILVFGVLFDFTGNSNASQVQPAKEMIQEAWFKTAMEAERPVDLVLLIGHNPIRPEDPVSTFKIVFDAIRRYMPDKPIAIFGGHTHIRSMAVYDNASIALESGRYCETLGWKSLSGFNSSTSGFRGPANPAGVPNPSRPATNSSSSPWVWSRRYLDWNRNTFRFHVNKTGEAFNTHHGLEVTKNITDIRDELNLGQVIGCVNQTYCATCVDIDDKDSIYKGVLVPALQTVVVNETRADKPRLMLLNTGVVRYDLYQGPVTLDDSYIVSPFNDTFWFIPDLPCAKAKNITDRLNHSGLPSKRDLAFMSEPRDICTDPDAAHLNARDIAMLGGIGRRQKTLTPGYITTDDWGTDGDDTQHTLVPTVEIPPFFDARANFPEDGSDPETCDLVFLDFISRDIIAIVGSEFEDMVQCYVNCTFTTRDFLLPYARLVWQDNKDNCPIS